MAALCLMRPYLETLLLITFREMAALFLMLPYIKCKYDLVYQIKGGFFHLTLSLKVLYLIGGFYLKCACFLLYLAK